MATAKRQRAARRLAALAYPWPTWVWAMQQCPPNPDGPSWGATALAWLTLLAFGMSGLAVPVVSFRFSAGRQRLRRLWALLLGSLGMLAVWLLGIWLFFVFFVLTCATF